jgi:transposase
MEKKNMILALRKLGWSYRRIERETGVRRETIAKYARSEDSKPATLPPGSEAQSQPTHPLVQPSLAASYHHHIEESLTQGLSAKRIYQDLCAAYAYPGSYDSIKRYVRKIKAYATEVYARIEVAPGEEAQVDFTKAAPTLHPATGTYRCPSLFKMTLSCSRYSYEEVVWAQDVESFIRCHERAFQEFGGVPKIMRLDNLKAGVTRACLYDPELNKLYAAFARHAGFTPLPCKVRMPHHKGKVERDIGYTKSNALKGKRFESLDAQNAHLRNWNKTVASLRIHGSTKQQVLTRFLTLEKGALQPLPDTPFALFHFALRKVHPDGYIELKKAYYSVPHQYLGREVEVRFNDHLLEVYCDHQLITVHKRTDLAGQFHTQMGHLPKHKSLRQEGYQRMLLGKADHVGESALKWAKEALDNKGPLSFRLIQGMLSLTRTYPKEQVDWACRIASLNQLFSYRILKKLLTHQKHHTTHPQLIQEHELLRPLSYYTQLTHREED